MAVDFDCWSSEESTEMRIKAKAMTIDEANSMLLKESTEKYCPENKSNCMGHGCAFFIITKPNITPYRCAMCTYAGRRPLAGIYGVLKREVIE